MLSVSLASGHPSTEPIRRDYGGTRPQSPLTGHPQFGVPPGRPPPWGAIAAMKLPIAEAAEAYKAAQGDTTQ